MMNYSLYIIVLILLYSNTKREKKNIKVFIVFSKNISHVSMESSIFL